MCRNTVIVNRTCIYHASFTSLMCLQSCFFTLVRALSLDLCSHSLTHSLTYSLLSLFCRPSLTSVPGIMKWALNDFSYGRNYVFKKASADVMSKTGGNYPAPLAILDVVCVRTARIVVNCSISSSLFFYTVSVCQIAL